MKAILLILLLVTGLSASLSGLLLILHPQGESFGFSSAVLQFSPFSNFLLPGIILAAIGLVHLLAILLWSIHSNLKFDMAVTAGLLLCGWIVGQMILLRMVNGWQISFLFVGLLTVLSAYELKKSAAS